MSFPSSKGILKLCPFPSATNSIWIHCSSQSREVEGLWANCFVDSKYKYWIFTKHTIDMGKALENMLSKNPKIMRLCQFLRKKCHVSKSEADFSYCHSMPRCTSRKPWCVPRLQKSWRRSWRRGWISRSIGKHEFFRTLIAYVSSLHGCLPKVTYLTSAHMPYISPAYLSSCICIHDSSSLHLIFSQLSFSWTYFLSRFDFYWHHQELSKKHLDFL